MSSPGYSDVVIGFRCTNYKILRPGARLRVVGNLQSLGAWDVEKAVCFEANGSLTIPYNKIFRNPFDFKFLIRSDNLILWQKDDKHTFDPKSEEKTFDVAFHGGEVRNIKNQLIPPGTSDRGFYDSAFLSQEPLCVTVRIQSSVPVEPRSRFALGSRPSAGENGRILRTRTSSGTHTKLPGPSAVPGSGEASGQTTTAATKIGSAFPGSTCGVGTSNQVNDRGDDRRSSHFLAGVYGPGVAWEDTEPMDLLQRNKFVCIFKDDVSTESQQITALELKVEELRREADTARQQYHEAQAHVCQLTAKLQQLQTDAVKAAARDGEVESLKKHREELLEQLRVVAREKSAMQETLAKSGAGPHAKSGRWGDSSGRELEWTKRELERMSKTTSLVQETVSLLQDLLNAEKQKTEQQEKAISVLTADKRELEARVRELEVRLRNVSAALSLSPSVVASSTVSAVPTKLRGDPRELAVPISPACVPEVMQTHQNPFATVAKIPAPNLRSPAGLGGLQTSPMGARPGLSDTSAQAARSPPSISPASPAERANKGPVSGFPNDRWKPLVVDAFKYFDHNQDNEIDIDEFSYFIKKVFGSDPSQKDELMPLVAYFDANSNGVLDQDEFVALVAACVSRCTPVLQHRIFDVLESLRRQQDARQPSEDQLIEILRRLLPSESLQAVVPPNSVEDSKCRLM